MFFQIKLLPQRIPHMNESEEIFEYKLSNFSAKMQISERSFAHPFDEIKKTVGD